MPRVVQYILHPILHPTVLHPTSPALYCTLLPTLETTSSFSVFVKSPSCLLYSLFLKGFHEQVISYSICRSLTYFTQHNSFQVHPCCCKWQIFFLSNGSVALYSGICKASSDNFAFFLFLWDGFVCCLYAGQEATVRTGQGTTGWFQIGKGVRQGCIF